MNHKDKALRIAYTAFRTMAEQGGDAFTSSELRTIGYLCALALPMKHRFTREELDRMKEVKGPNAFAGINAI